MFLSTDRLNKSKPIIFILLILPSLAWFVLFFRGSLGINPIDKLMDELGQMALRLLIFTVFISVISKYNKFRSLQVLRRIIGLFAFYYVCLHFFTYITLDHFFNWSFIIKDIYKRPFITLGFLSFIFLIPLAITSNNYMIKKITFKIWKQIHKLIYLITPLACIHYFLLTKADKTEPLIYFIIFIILVLMRYYKKINLKKN